MDPRDVSRIVRDVLVHHSSAWELSSVAIDEQGFRARLTLRDRAREVKIAVPIGSPIALRSAVGRWLDDGDE